ncbi:MAG TPA: glutamate-5-semialdehyde dehydrogenase [Lachnospiraceae bacterium]|nr:glutamate-5-semialdehyde dehydrogenase [Lachnospiraceae bacterium]
MIDLQSMGKNAVKSKYELQKKSTEDKNKVLNSIAEQLILHSEQILKANEEDIHRGEANHMHPGLLDRLRLNQIRIEAMAEGLKQVVGLPDPIGEVLDTFTRPNGLMIEKRRVPIGVIGIIYESRPNVTVDAFGLCFKAGNVVILKGGSDALSSNIAIAGIIRDTLEKEGFAADMMQLIDSSDREVTHAFMRLNEYVDLLIPRGGAGLIKNVVENSTIPVIETGTGNCHVYVDKDADLTMAVNVIVNAKTQRIGVCNSCESLVIHQDIKESFLPVLADALRKHKVEMRGDDQVCSLVEDCIPATEEDYGKEYLDDIISMKVVSSEEEAIAHINKYNTKHSEAIITSNADAAEQFVQEIDAACVYVNASTRFTDGFEFGLGAEIGISTQKLHARGPMGLKELTSYKYTIFGNGQIRA